MGEGLTITYYVVHGPIWDEYFHRISLHMVKPRLNGVAFLITARRLDTHIADYPSDPAFVLASHLSKQLLQLDVAKANDSNPE